MKFKEGATVTTSDFWYDLTDGGYIKPKDLLENLDDILSVERAKELLLEFKRQAEAQGVLEEI
jgi:hypothetical protein